MPVREGFKGGQFLNKISLSWPATLGVSSPKDPLSRIGCKTQPADHVINGASGTISMDSLKAGGFLPKTPLAKIFHMEEILLGAAIDRDMTATPYLQLSGIC